MSGFVVVDASLAVKWLVEEEDSARATALTRHWDDDDVQLAAPVLMPFEVANALHKRVVRGELTVQVAAGLMDDLMSLGIAFHDPTSLYRRALELASELGQGGAYDAHYLALAESLGCELWTADQRFQRPASASGNVHWLGEFRLGG